MPEVVYESAALEHILGAIILTIILCYALHRYAKSRTALRHKEELNRACTLVSSQWAQAYDHQAKASNESVQFLTELVGISQAENVDLKRTVRGQAEIMDGIKGQALRVVKIQMPEEIPPSHGTSHNREEQTQ